MSARRKLSPQEVLWVRKQRARPLPNGRLKSYAALGKAVGCSPQHARDIVHGNRRRQG